MAAANPVCQVTEELIKRGVYGVKLGAMIAEWASRQVSSTGSTAASDPENQIAPSAEHKDALRPATPGDYVRRSDTKVKERFTEFAEMMGGTEAVFGEGFSSNDHNVGTTIMATIRPTRSSTGLPHPRYNNLFVASSSVLPIASTVNPTLTIAALSFRIPDTLREALR